MDLNQLRVFVRVIESGSFTAAARSTGMPKSTVSAWVSQLEEHLQVRLLHRTTRQLRLTDAGTALFQRASRIVADAEDAERAVTDDSDAPRGKLRITAPVDLAGLWLGGLVAEYRQKYPEVVVESVISDRVLDLIDDGIDVAVRVGPLRESSLIARRLTNIHSHLYASGDYLERRGRPKQPADVLDHDCLIFSSPTAAETWILEHEETGAVERLGVSGPLRSGSNQMVCDAAISGMGIALLSGIVFTGRSGCETLERVLPEWSGPDTLVSAVYPSNRHLSARVRAFVDLAATYFARLPDAECDAA